MLVTTNIMAQEEIPTPITPAYEVTHTTICRKDTLYHVERSKVHILVEQVWYYNKKYKVWMVQSCKVS